MLLFFVKGGHGSHGEGQRALPSPAVCQVPSAQNSPPVKVAYLGVETGQRFEKLALIGV